MKVDHIYQQNILAAHSHKKHQEGRLKIEDQQHERLKAKIRKIRRPQPVSDGKSNKQDSKGSCPPIPMQNIGAKRGPQKLQEILSGGRMSYEDKFLAGGDPHADRYHSTKNIREVGQHDMKKSIELYTERAAIA